jgi:methyltransferase
MIFGLFLLFIVLLRFGELLHSKKNEKWLIAQGAVEYGHNHYPIIIALHVLFIFSLVIEYCLSPSAVLNPYFLFLYLVLIAIKVWVIFSLGKFWNTKIYRIQKYPLIKSGLYKYFSHPNYLIVSGEIAIIPLTFQLYYTACLFTVLNAIMLYVRIKVENRVLQHGI